MLISTAPQLADKGSILDQVRQILADSLQLGERAEHYSADTPLLGSIPELDSMAVVTLIADLEAYFHIIVEDDDDLAGAFETLGSLSAYVSDKQPSSRSGAGAPDSTISLF